eukprot:1160724-Pelagomonas_calceolata.AAC.8
MYQTNIPCMEVPRGWGEVERVGKGHALKGFIQGHQYASSLHPAPWDVPRMKSDAAGGPRCSLYRLARFSWDGKGYIILSFGLPQLFSSADESGDIFRGYRKGLAPCFSTENLKKSFPKVRWVGQWSHQCC